MKDEAKMPRNNDVTSTTVRTRTDESLTEVDSTTRKGDDMTRGTGTHDRRQVRGTGLGKKLAEGLRSRALPTPHAGDPRLDQAPLKLIRFQTVRDRTGLSRSTIWRLERTGAFPKHHRISANAVAWVEQDVVDWMKAKASA
jgi:prophage regulatory protein